MVGNESHFIVHDGGTSALGVGFREADPRPWKTMIVDWLLCGVRGRRRGRCTAVDECTDVEGEEHEGCGAVEKSILRWG